jgi:hypothetical protein
MADEQEDSENRQNRQRRQDVVEADFINQLGQWPRHADAPPQYPFKSSASVQPSPKRPPKHHGSNHCKPDLPQVRLKFPREANQYGDQDLAPKPAL